MISPTKHHSPEGRWHFFHFTDTLSSRGRRRSGTRIQVSMNIHPVPYPHEALIDGNQLKPVSLNTLSSKGSAIIFIQKIFIGRLSTL